MNYLETFYDVFLLLFFYSFIFFSDYIPDIELRYRIGTLYVTLSAICALVAVIPIFYDLYVGVRIKYLKKIHET
jgi:hypothetical protein